MKRQARNAHIKNALINVQKPVTTDAVSISFACRRTIKVHALEMLILAGRFCNAKPRTRGKGRFSFRRSLLEMLITEGTSTSNKCNTRYNVIFKRAACLAVKFCNAKQIIAYCLLGAPAVLEAATPIYRSNYSINARTNPRVFTVKSTDKCAIKRNNRRGCKVGNVNKELG